MSRENHLIVRVDADSLMGAGHLMRCLALAQGWKARGRDVIFITACRHDGLLHRLSKEGFEIVRLETMHPDSKDWETTSDILAKYSGAWVVLDGYHFDPGYQKLITDSGCHLMLFDDCGEQPFYHAHLILNQNINAESLNYSCRPGAQLLLGTKHVQLRSEFLLQDKWQRQIPKIARKILVTMGLNDPNNQVLKVIRALTHVHIDGLEVIIVIGTTNHYLQELQSEVHHLHLPVRFIKNPNSMPELMAWADIAVSAGGSTCWELAFMGLPSILLIMAKNQQEAVKILDARGIFQNAGWFTEITENNLAQIIEELALDKQRRRSMSEAGRMQVDGFGRGRVLDALDRTIHNDPVH